MGRSQENEKNSDALDTGGGACCYNRGHSEPGAGPGTSKREIPVEANRLGIWGIRTNHGNPESSPPNFYSHFYSHFLILKNPMHTRNRLLLTSTFLFCWNGFQQSEAEEQHVCRYCASARYAIAAKPKIPTIRNARKYAPDRWVDVLHIKLDVTPHFSKQTVSGTVTIVFKPISKPLSELKLDAVDIDVLDVRSTHAIEGTSSTSEDLTIVFQEPIQRGKEASVEIDFHAQPVKGLYFRTPEMGYLKSEMHVWTQGEAIESRHWYPCFDHPHERSSTEMICHVPLGMTVLSNGVLKGETIDKQSKMKTVRWLQKKPHVNYLISLVAGYFKSIGNDDLDIPLRFYTQPQNEQYAKNSFLDTADIIDFFEKETGVAFPWDKYYQVTVLDCSWGGMENTSVTTLGHHTLFTEATENIRSARFLDAHETAHQWFGDYVTCKDWSHLWLNEGFATYYTHLYEEHKSGRDAMLYGLYKDARDQILTKESDTRPIVYRQYGHPSDQFDYRAYPKGSWVLHMLRSQLGVDLYRRCIQTYLERNALTDVETADLQTVFEELSGRSLDRFFDQWIYHARHPDLKIEYRWLPKEKHAGVTIHQTQTTNDKVLLFHLPTTIRFIVDGKSIDRPLDISKKKQEFYFPLPAEPQVVRFDPEYTTLAEVSFKKPIAMLIAQLENQADAIGRIYAAEELGKLKQNKATEALSKALRSDPFWGVRVEASSALQATQTDQALDALAASLQQTDARVRLQIVQDFGKFYNQRSRDLLFGVLKKEHNPAIVSAAIRGLGIRHDEQSAKTVREFLRSQSFRNQLVRAALEAINQIGSEEFIPDLIALLKTRERELESRDVGFALQTLGKISHQTKESPVVRDLLLSYVNSPREIIRISAMLALGQLGDDGVREILETVADNDRLDRAASAARSALDMLDEQSRSGTTSLSQLREQLREVKEEHAELKEKVDLLQSRWNEQEQQEAEKS